MAALRHLMGFFALGALLFFGKRAVEAEAREHELPRLVVSVPARASDPEVARAIDEAVLVHEALARGGALIDPLVREQLLRSMRFQEAEGSDDAALLDRALGLGLHLADPLVRQRLAFQAQQMLRAKGRSATPSEAELAQYFETRAERYREPARASFAQVFLSRARRAHSLEADVKTLGARLMRGQVSPAHAHAVSDPTILPLELTRVSAADIAARFGPGVSQSVLHAPEAQWTGPISSSYGVHFVFVRERISARMPTLAEVRRRVLADYRHDHTERVLAQELKGLRERVRIELRRVGS